MALAFCIALCACGCEMYDGWSGDGCCGACVCGRGGVRVSCVQRLAVPSSRCVRAGRCGSAVCLAASCVVRMSAVRGPPVRPLAAAPRWPRWWPSQQRPQPALPSTARTTLPSAVDCAQPQPHPGPQPPQPPSPPHWTQRADAAPPHMQQQQARHTRGCHTTAAATGHSSAHTGTVRRREGGEAVVGISCAGWRVRLVEGGRSASRHSSLPNLSASPELCSAAVCVAAMRWCALRVWLKAAALGSAGRRGRTKLLADWLTYTPPHCTTARWSRRDEAADSSAREGSGVRRWQWGAQTRGVAAADRLARVHDDGSQLLALQRAVSSTERTAEA